jgi:hypothetical protein
MSEDSVADRNSQINLSRTYLAYGPFRIFCGKKYLNLNFEVLCLVGPEFLARFDLEPEQSFRDLRPKPQVPDWRIKSTLAFGLGRIWHRVAHGKCVLVDLK